MRFKLLLTRVINFRKEWKISSYYISIAHIPLLSINTFKTIQLPPGLTSTYPTLTPLESIQLYIYHPHRDQLWLSKPLWNTNSDYTDRRRLLRPVAPLISSVKSAKDAWNSYAAPAAAAAAAAASTMATVTPITRNALASERH